MALPQALPDGEEMAKMPLTELLARLHLVFSQCRILAQLYVDEVVMTSHKCVLHQGMDRMFQNTTALCHKAVGPTADARNETGYTLACDPSGGTVPAHS